MLTTSRSILESKFGSRMTIILIGMVVTLLGLYYCWFSYPQTW